MNISDVSVRLTEKDILSIIDDYLKIDEIKINQVDIKECIKVQGTFSKGIKIKFAASLGIESIENNMVKLRLLNIKIGVLPISIKLVNFILKKVLRKLSDMGIYVDKGYLCIDFKLLCKYIPSVEFYLNHITILKGGLEVEVKDLIYSESKQAISLDELKEQIASTKMGDGSLESDEKSGEKTGDGSREFTKVNDEYSKLRSEVVEMAPDKYEKVVQCLMMLPDIVVLLYRLMKDKRVPIKTKVLIGSALGYLALPYDIIPDSIPILGKGDDFGIGFIVLDKIIDNVPRDVILENWQGNDDIIYKVSEVKEIIFDTIGRKNAIKIAAGTFIFFKKRKHKAKV